MTVTGRPFLVPSCPPADHAADRCLDRVVMALRGGAVVTAHRVLGGVTRHRRGVVVGIAGSGSGPGGEQRFHIGAGLGVEQPAECAHPVRALPAQGQPAPARPIRVGVRAVGVEQRGQPGGALAQLFGPKLAGHLGQLGFGGLPGADIDGGGQRSEEPADQPHVLGPDPAGPLRRRSAGQHWFEALPGQRRPRTQIGGLGDVAPCRTAADQQPPRQNVGQAGAAQLGRAGLFGQPIDQPVAHRGQPAAQGFHPGQHVQHLAVGQPVNREFRDTLEGGVNGIERGCYRLPIRHIIRTHIRTIPPRTDSPRKLSTVKASSTGCRKALGCSRFRVRWLR